MKLQAQGLRFRIGGFQLGPLDLAVEEGEAYVVLGPPGSGKTLLLECLCGLLRPEGGRIQVDRRDVTALPPGKRGIGYVPQDYALFPHLTVEGNIAFGLGPRGGRSPQGREAARRTAALLGIQHLLPRSIAGLSGGERQRTALARALVRKPALLLLDEPVSALDEATREMVLGELRNLQEELRFTMVYVCHNLEEAFAVARRAGLMHQGRFVQEGTMSELLRRPRSLFAARFMRCENILPCRILREEGGPGGILAVGPRRWRLPSLPAGVEGEVHLAIRPEEVELLEGPEPPRGEGILLEVRLLRREDRGGYFKWRLSAPELELTAHLSPEKALRLGPQAEEGPLRAWIRREALLFLGSRDPHL